MWSNFHAHSNYCDGKSELTDYVRTARENEVFSLGFSSHAPLPFSNPWCMKPGVLDNYIDLIHLLKINSPMEIYSGLEVDFIPGLTGPKKFSNQLDYTIGSIHFVDELPDGTRWEIDGTHAFFIEGYEKIFKKQIRHVLARYFELTREMLMSSCPTILGHLDKIKIQNRDDSFFDENDSWYQQEVRQTIDVCASVGAIIEVNTRGLYQKKSRTPYPSPWALDYIRQQNIPITLSSDAHHADDIVNQFPETAAILKTIGFKSITILHEGKWKPFSFNENGIILP